MREKRFADQCKSEAGTVLILVAAGMLALLLFLALVLDQGVRYAGRTELQQLADATSQAALVAALQGDPNAPVDYPELQKKAKAAAMAVANNTPIMQGFDASKLVVEFGTYDFQAPDPAARFKTIDQGAPPQAVRVSASKSGADSFQSILNQAPISADAQSVAALPCRNVIFVQDVSSSFRDDIEKVKEALKKTVKFLADRDPAGIQTRVGLVAFRNIVVDSVTSDELVAPGDKMLLDKINLLSDPSVLCAESIKVEPATATQQTKYIVPACVGSDMRGGLEVAEDLLESAPGKFQGCEDFVLTISDGVPCEVTEANLDNSNEFIAVFGPAQNNEPQGGGSTRQSTLSYVDEEMREFGSIAVLTANSDRTGGDALNDFLKRCPTDTESSAQMQQVNSEFANKLITGFGQAFESKLTAEAMAGEMSKALQGLPPVVVH